MVSGTLALKNGYYYAVLSYRDAAGKRHQKWVSTGLPQKGNKRRAEQELIRIRSEFEIPRVAGELSSNMLFADYLDQWLEIVRARIKPATFGSYQGMVKSTIGPYFRKKELTLKELEARHIDNAVFALLYNAHMVNLAVALPIKEDDLTCRRLKAVALPLPTVFEPLHPISAACEFRYHAAFNMVFIVPLTASLVFISAIKSLLSLKRYRY